MGTFVFWKHPSLYPRCGDAQRESCVVTLRVPRAFQEMGSNVGLASTWSSRLSLRTIHRFAFWSFDEGQEVSCLRIGFGKALQVRLHAPHAVSRGHPYRRVGTASARGRRAWAAPRARHVFLRRPLMPPRQKQGAVGRTTRWCGARGSTPLRPSRARLPAGPGPDAVIGQMTTKTWADGLASPTPATAGVR